MSALSHAEADERTCALPDCDNSLDGLRVKAKYCCSAHRQRAWKARSGYRLYAVRTARGHMEASEGVQVAEIAAAASPRREERKSRPSGRQVAHGKAVALVIDALTNPLTNATEGEIRAEAERRVEAALPVRQRARLKP